MPHSSGGGSHGGGSHGGSHSSGGHGGSGSGSASRRHSSTYFNGARHYVYYKNKKPVHFYSDVEITPEYIKKRKRTWKLIRIVLAVFYMFMFLVSGLTASLSMPHKLTWECVDPIRIVDNNSMISASEEAALMEQLQEFRDKTGISVTILTVHDDEWEDNFYTLENYAFDYYVSNMSDEANWLIVYSEPESYTGFNDWKWEGMQGDDTDGVLTDSSTDKFNAEMQKNITKDGFPKAVAETFDYFNDIVMKTSINFPFLIISFFAMALHASIFFFVTWLVFGNNIKIDEKAIELENPQYRYVEDTCAYCGGMYIHGIHTSCPHCGAPVQPLNSQF